MFSKHRDPIVCDVKSKNSDTKLCDGIELHSANLPGCECRLTRMYCWLKCASASLELNPRRPDVDEFKQTLTARRVMRFNWFETISKK